MKIFTNPDVDDIEFYPPLPPARLSTEDKDSWTAQEPEREQYFIDHIALIFGLKAVRNPAKDLDPYTIDMIIGGRYSDLKCQCTPFFTAGRYYKVPPQYAITFNWKDAARYERLYPDADVYFWVVWPRCRGYDVNVDAMAGVWRASMAELRVLIATAPTHTYGKRGEADTQGNATGSYVLDLRQLHKLGDAPDFPGFRK